MRTGVFLLSTAAAISLAMAAWFQVAMRAEHSPAAPESVEVPRRWIGDWRPPVESIDRDKVVAFWLIGSSSPRDEDRRVGLNIKRDGWQGFVEQRILPQIQWGVRRVQIHNPFGHRASEGMRLDQYLLAQEQGVVWLVDGFVEAWRPITSGQRTGEPVEVICYFGSPVIHNPFKRLYEQGRLDEWRLLLDACIEPALEAGMSVAFDTATGAKKDHPFYAYACELRDRGVRVYLEGLPSRGLPHWWDFNFIIMEHYLRRLDDIHWVAARSSVTGEVLWLVDRVPSGKTRQDMSWGVPHYADILARGYTLNARMGWLAPEHFSFGELLTAARVVVESKPASARSGDTAVSPTH